jgi:predicted DNA-binding transcriptional regulator AlpA
MLKVSPKTLYQWAEQSVIPCVKLKGALRFDLDDIKKWIQNCKKDTNSGYNPLRSKVPGRREAKNGTL